MAKPVTIGVSLKMYFGNADARRWCRTVAGIASRSDAIQSGAVELFVLPGYLALADAVSIFAGSPVRVGAQDLAACDSGAFTGEVSGTDLAEIGVTLAAVGHAERRRLFGEEDHVVAAKTAAAIRNGLTPVVCVGETDDGPVGDAVAAAIAQLRGATVTAGPGALVVAYEPVWAIGTDRAAPSTRVRQVIAALRSELEVDPARTGSRVIYGGAAGPGVFSDLAPEVDGVFLGRFAHDPRGLEEVLEEAAAAARSDSEPI